MDIRQMGDQTYKEKIMGIQQIGDLILYKKNCSNMKNLIKKRWKLNEREIRRTERK